MVRLLGSFTALLLFGISFAQEQADLLGTWKFETVAAKADERCGEVTMSGEVHVRMKITARAYRGSTTSRRTSEQCASSQIQSSDFTLRIRDDKVTIEYDEEGWAKDSLVLDGTTLSGFDSGGTPLEYVKFVAEPAQPTTVDTSQLDKLLEELRPEFYDSLGKEFGTNVIQNLMRTGLDSQEARQVAEETIGRMADCVLDMVREQIVASSVPPDEIAQNRTTAILLQPQNIDYRDYKCIYDTALNAGVVIK